MVVFTKKNTMAWRDFVKLTMIATQGPNVCLVPLLKGAKLIIGCTIDFDMFGWFRV